MVKRTFSLFFILSILFLSFVWISAFEHRTKRYLTFVNRHSPVLQMIFGVGIPVDLELEAVTIGYVFKNSFQLPSNVTDFTNFLSDPFDVETHSISGRSVNEGVEILSSGSGSQENGYFGRSGKLSIESQNGKQANDLASTRWLIYKGLAKMAENYGLAGRSCVLRTICESAHTPFDYSNGILGELFHVIMSPSESNDEIIYNGDNEYLHAENLGRGGAPCEHVFSECKVSLLEKFSGIY